MTTTIRTLAEQWLRDLLTRGDLVGSDQNHVATEDNEDVGNGLQDLGVLAEERTA